jgi:peroxiredoxin Q/BCP
MRNVFIHFAAVAALGMGPQERMLQPGDRAPDFTLPGSDGKTYSLADYRGFKPVVIAWFPKANTKT